MRFQQFLIDFNVIGHETCNDSKNALVGRGLTFWITKELSDRLSVNVQLWWSEAI